MSIPLYLKLTGTQQGLISAGCGAIESVGSKDQKSHGNEIFILSLNHGIFREQSCSHQPVTFSKPVDKSSSLLGISFSDNEKLTAEFCHYRINGNGKLEQYYPVKLSNASIEDLSSVHPNILNSSEKMSYETISIRYKSITWQHNIAGTSGYNLWTDQVY